MAAEHELKELKELRELVEFLKENGIAEFDMEREDLKVRLKFAGMTPAAPSVDMTQLARAMAAQAGGGESIPSLGAAAAVAPMEAGAAAVAAAAQPAAATGVEAGAHIVKSPIVGTFYDAPSPEAEAFVKVGDHVSSGQVLCIIEAMKLMNEIESDAAGEIVKVYVKTAQPVEYGQALFAIR
ncbi:MAG TPA: acetyl-CoA carboxylase biotin carboxyl carrier protein [Acidobacteriaceae bacterium]|jgi:acetyl-CoA carboxylase biotin carboxyl carrier protein|nr:acetyl-CoA carboxylase biotin carboxyl carrier protein [Acidobacteriaceae bacterium]